MHGGFVCSWPLGTSQQRQQASTPTPFQPVQSDHRVFGSDGLVRELSTPYLSVFWVARKILYNLPRCLFRMY